MQGQAGLREDIAATAARLVAEEGLDFGTAKRRAARDLGLGRDAPLPDNLALEQALRDYLLLFHGDTQPAELRALRNLALRWMERLHAFRPHLAAAVWNGTATRLNDIEIDLYCDDPKMVELTLIDQQVRYDQAGGSGLDGQAASVLSVQVRCDELQAQIGIHLRVHDRDQMRGAIRPDGRGRPPRGDTVAVRRLLDVQAAP